MTIIRNLILAFGVVIFSSFSFGQITANGHVTSEITAYTNGALDDSIYVWCADSLTGYQASLTANSPSGVGPYTFIWSFYDESTSSWSSLTTETGSSSTLNNLPTDGYLVQIYDNGGAETGCYIAWVWNLGADVDIAETITDCDAVDLVGTINTVTDFTYYNPPSPSSLISSTSEITICFDATHTYVSDLGFYLIGPATCGSPVVNLSPNPGSIGQGSVCNSGDNVVSLCFTTNAAANLDVCSALTPLTGTYSSYGSPATPIDWSPLYGCNAAEADWAVQIYDCIGADVGAMTYASLTFDNLSTSCNASPSISYASGSINEAINDNSCDPQTASIFQVSQQVAPIILSATTTYTWSSSSPSVVFTNPTTDLNQSLTNMPSGNTTIYLTVQNSYNGYTCSSSYDSLVFENTCCNAVAEAGTDTLVCSGTSVQIGSPVLTGMEYVWTPSTGLISATTAQPTATLTNTTSTIDTVMYTVEVIDTANNCSKFDSVYIVVPPVASIFDNDTACFQTYQITGTESFFGGYWSVADTNLTIYPDSLTANPAIQSSIYGTFNVTYTDSVCNTETTSSIYFAPSPWVFLVDTTLCLGVTYEMTASAEPTSYLYEWNSGETSGPTIYVAGPGVYTVDVTNICGTASASAVVDYRLCDIIVPNIVSLSSLVGNNVWGVEAEGIDAYHCRITNRWGDLIFETHDIEEGWSGTNTKGALVSEGTYFYIIDATIEGGDALQKHGFIEVVH